MHRWPFVLRRTNISVWLPFLRRDCDQTLRNAMLLNRVLTGLVITKVEVIVNITTFVAGFSDL